jgi:hypothetical protein
MLSVSVKPVYDPTSDILLVRELNDRLIPTVSWEEIQSMLFPIVERMNFLSREFSQNLENTQFLALLNTGLKIQQIYKDLTSRANISYDRQEDDRLIDLINRHLSNQNVSAQVLWNSLEAASKRIVYLVDNFKHRLENTRWVELLNVGREAQKKYVALSKQIRSEATLSEVNLSFGSLNIKDSEMKE